jgi:signal transduction histidine kinase/ligand-binding sensor domain-containing protein
MLAKRFDMFKIRSLLLNLIICLAGVTCFAQKVNKPDRYRAVLWTSQDGLNTDYFNVMLKDEKGFLWIGSFFGELTRFDGARFKTFMPDPKKPGAINAGGITALAEDSLHNIWMATERGVSRYDIQTDLFTNFLTEIDSTTSDGSIIPFGSTKTHIYCFESRNRIVTFDIRSLEKKTILTSLQPLNSLINDLSFGSGLFSNAILDSKSNSVWLLAPSSEKGANGLIQFSLIDGKRTTYSWPVIYPDRMRVEFESMKLDRKRNLIWISTTSGLFEFSLKSKQFRLIDALNEITKTKDYQCFSGIDIDRDGQVWFSTNPHGIFIYDPETNQAHKLFSDPKLQKEVSEPNLQIYIDPDGIVWASYYGAKGLYELVPYSPFVRMYSNGSTNNSLSHSTVTSIIPGAQGKMWIGTLDGLNIFDPVTEKFEILREKDFKGLKGKVFAPLFVDTANQIAWISADTELNYWNMKVYEVDLKNMNAYPVNFRDGSKLLDSLVYSPTLAKPFRGKYLIAEDNYGVFELKPGSREAELLIPFAFPKVSFVIGDGILFFEGLSKTGLNSTFKLTGDGRWTSVPHVFDSLKWSDIGYDSINRSYWVCLRNEILLYDEDFNKIKSFKPDEKASGRILETQVDRSGNLWFSNLLRQVGKANRSTGSVYYLSELDGYQKQFFDQFAPSAKDGMGNIYFGNGTTSGSASAGSLALTMVQPGNESSASPARVYFKTLSVNEREYPLSISVNNLQELSVRHNENNITLEAGIIDYYARGGGRLRFKLEGEDIQHEWLYMGPDLPIRLENLQPGSYKLLVQASTIGTEMMSPEKILSITISKPYWQTWAFRIFALVVFISVVYGFVQYRSRSLKQQNALLEEKITVRTNDLKRSLDELKATQAQLIQSEKMASLGQLTAGIAHEIQNPLNFVQNFSELSQELLDEMKHEIKNGNLDAAWEISENVKENLAKVLHHGKRADGIVKGMLQHSRSSSGTKEPTSINNLADEYLRLAFHGLRAKDKTFNSAVETNFDESVGSINVIPQDIGRVVLNLITNAFYAVTEKKKKLGETYEPTVMVATKRAHGKIEISVKDNGSGIPQAIIEKIFQPFFTTKPTGEGTGLGLSLSYDIIKAHNGELEVETKEGEWSVFKIILPAV